MLYEPVGSYVVKFIQALAISQGQRERAMAALAGAAAVLWGGLGYIRAFFSLVWYIVSWFKPEWLAFWLLGAYMAYKQEHRHKKAKLHSDATAVLTDVRDKFPQIGYQVVFRSPPPF